MIQIRQAVIVEGKYDKIKLKNILDTMVLTTDGFGIFKNREKLDFFRKVAVQRGLVILTDSDAAGFQIRSFLGGSIPKEQIIHVYIPDVFGKERRKKAPSSEGKLGVEGMDAQILLDAFQRAGVHCQTALASFPKGRAVTTADLYADGISGAPRSQTRKKQLLCQLGLPERMSTKALLEFINSCLSYDEYQSALEKMHK